MKKRRKDGYTFKERFNYWFDNRMTKGSLSFIRILIIASILLAVLIAALIILFKFNEEGETASVFWDSIATVINAWMPSFEDGSPGYIILMAACAIAGLLFTSVLIGIVTSSIEEKIVDLKKGNSSVLEKGHIVILGFNEGEYTLLRELILAAEGREQCIVLAEDIDREEMEQALDENLDVPKNVRIVCRTADITDPASLEKCSIENCKTVIISPADETRTVKAILAVTALLKDKDASDVSISAIIPQGVNRFPASLMQAHHINALPTNVMIAKVIAHSCTQRGLSETFREIFNFEGSEFYVISIPEAVGMTFGDVALRMDKAVPLGIVNEGSTLIDPPFTRVIGEGDSILVFSDESESARLVELPEGAGTPDVTLGLYAGNPTGAVFIGRNELLPMILRELPDNVRLAYIDGRGLEDGERTKLEAAAQARDLALNLYEYDPRTEEGMLALAKLSEHVIVLNDHEGDPDEADTDVIFHVLNLRDIRARHELPFNITVEMQKERNQNLVGDGSYTDFLITTSLSSLFLAQLAENPELIGVFRELLSNDGCELFLKNVGDAGIAGSYRMGDLRSLLLQNGYILLGFIDAEKRSRFNPPVNETVTIRNEDCLIVIGED
ncbi:MAG: hypothetical protein IKO51_07730 [Clostridia bacterium]|nr:hypothetical protein [Clostridia bacterium]